tara:strand:+ start:321 stop:1247 length:927 start_codon:yes stop_codon:yes gene_type:complete
MSNINVGHASNVIHENKKYFDENIRCLSEREVAWLQLYLADKISKVSFLSTRSNNLHEELITQLAKLENFKEVTYEACMKMSHVLLPNKHFQLIEENLRAQVFTLKILINEYDYDIEIVDTKDIIKSIYYYFDRQENRSTVENKIFLIKNIISIYKEVISNENYTKWLSNHGQEILFWVFNYLNRRNIMANVNNNIDSDEELKATILASLDLIDYPSYTKIKNTNYSYSTSANKEIIIDKMKRGWSQQKYRNAGKTKKPYHLPLTKKTKSRLEKMAQVQGLSETAMLDILINRFYEMEYVDVNGKDLY